MNDKGQLWVVLLSIRSYIALCAVAFLVLLVYLPLSVALPTDGLDPSWHLAISYGLSHGYQFGKDIVFTYGPFGSLFGRGGWPGLFYFSLVFWLILIVAFLVTNEKIFGDKSIEKRVFSITPLLLIISLDAFALYLFFSVAYSAKKIANSMFSVIIVFIALGILALSKFTFAVTAVFALIPLVIVLLLEKNGWKRHLAWIGFFSTMLLCWLAAKQSLYNIPAYILGSLEIATGYSAAMSIAGPINELFLGFFLFIFFAIYLFVVVFIRDVDGILKQQSLFCSFQTLSLLFITWVAFKQGYVRHDGHVFAFVAYIGSVILTIFFDKNNRLRFSIGWMELFVLFVWVMLFSSALNGQSWIKIFFDHSKNQIISVKKVFDEDDRIISFENSVNSIKNSYPLQTVSGASDIVSWDISRVLANNLTWKPRPVIQSYSAYTPWLANLNGNHVASKDTAAENYFVNVKTIDGHIALQDDPLIWPELLVRYEIKSLDQSVHMVRRKDPRNYVAKDYQLKEQDGFWILPNDSNYDFATLSAMPDLGFFNKLKSFLLKPSMVFIELKLVDGTTRHARFITSLGDTPFVLSPLVEGESDFALLGCLCDGLKNKKVIAFRFIDSKERVINPKNIPLLKSVSFQDGSRSQPGVSKLQDLARFKLISGLDDLSKNPILFYKNNYVLNAHSPSVFSYNTDAMKLDLCYGLREGAWQQPLFDGVQFSVKLSQTNNTLLYKILHPSLSATSEECSTISLPPGSKELILETRPNGNSSYDWAYWEIK